MKNLQKIIYIIIGVLLFSSLMQANAQIIITQWNFDNAAVAVNNTPAPSTGTGTSSAIGMTNTYGPSSSSVNTDDILVDQGTDTTPGSVDTSASNQAWRIRGQPGTGTDENGWNSAAPIGAQGGEFDLSTAGYTNLKLTFDMDITTQGEGLVQVEYTTNGINWTNATLTYTGGGGASVQSNSSATNNIVVGSYLDASLASPSSGSNWFNQITANFTGVTGITGVRIVNAATGSADVALKTSQGQINNTSGNWRLDDVTISGTQIVPEPSSYALMLGGFALLILYQRSRKNQSQNG